MPKTLKFALIFVLFLAIFAPEAQILAQERPSGTETSNYLPNRQELSQTLAKIPSFFINFIRQVIPISSPAQALKETNGASYITTIKNVKNFFRQFIQALGDIKDFIYNLLIQFYKKLYPYS